MAMRQCVSLLTSVGTGLCMSLYIVTINQWFVWFHSVNSKKSIVFLLLSILIDVLIFALTSFYFYIAFQQVCTHSLNMYYKQNRAVFIFFFVTGFNVVFLFVL